MKTCARMTLIAVLLASALASSGCLPLVATGAAVGTLAALDRRSIGAQTEDQEIELKAANRLRESLKQPGGVSVTSFNRKVLLTGQKLKKKVYYHHTGYIGGIKERTAGAIMEVKFPERVLEKAVERMVPRGPLGRRQMSNLRVYPGPHGTTRSNWSH